MPVITTSNQIANTLNNTYFAPACIKLGEITNNTDSYVQWELPADTNLWVGRHAYVEFVEQSIDSGEPQSILWSYWISPRILNCISNNGSQTNAVGCSAINTSDNFKGEVILPVASSNIMFGKNASGKYYVRFMKQWHYNMILGDRSQVQFSVESSSTLYTKAGCIWVAYIV